MDKLNSLLATRFQKKEKPKMSELGSKTSQGQLSAFTGVFGELTLKNQDQTKLKEILETYAGQELDITEDLFSLISITAEVRAIQRQSILLHGARISQAREILKKYREGAFTEWLTISYGNRQTPYNFLQYYEFYLKMPKSLHPQMEAIPKQAIYTLASREGNLEKKEAIIRNYNGETKQAMLTLIRAEFPLKQDDHRKENISENAIKQLEKLKITFLFAKHTFSTKHQKRICELLEDLKTCLQSD